MPECVKKDDGEARFVKLDPEMATLLDLLRSRLGGADGELPCNQSLIRLALLVANDTFTRRSRPTVAAAGWEGLIDALEIADRRTLALGHAITTVQREVAERLTALQQEQK